MTKRARVPRIGVAYPAPGPEALAGAGLGTLVTALYVKTGDSLAKDRRPGHPARLSQPELACLAVAQALPGFHSEHRRIRFARCHPRGCFPYLPHRGADPGKAARRGAAQARGRQQSCGEPIERPGMRRTGLARASATRPRPQSCL
jgi:hypothetical protein